MTTDPDVPITDSSGSHDALEATLVAAASSLAHHLGLGDRIERGGSWPGAGLADVVSVEVSGAIDATLLLAVTAAAADRLVGDGVTLAVAMRSAAEAMVLASGDPNPSSDVVVGDPQRRPATEVPRPDATMEILAGDGVAALVGLVSAVGAIGDVAAVGVNDAPGRVDATDAVFVPQSFAAEVRNDGAPAGPLSLLHDVDMEVTVELGRTVMPIRELLALQPGMVVEIDRAASAPIDVLVNGRRIACGEVVVIDEEFGIRITEIVTSGDVHR